MAENIEIKAVLHDPASVEERIKHYTGNDMSAVLLQADTFYKSPFGRIKIRTINNNINELIFYYRPDSAVVRKCKYYRFKLYFPRVIKGFLKKFFGIRSKVEKERRLYLYENTRIHLDTVKNLGSFIEFEYVVDRTHPEEKGYEIVKELMNKAGVTEKDIISVSYIDMLNNFGVQ